MLFWKKNKLTIIIFVILFLFTGYNVMKTVNEFENIYALENKTIEYCLENPDESDKELCEDALNADLPKADFYTIFSNIILFGYKNLFAIVSLIVILPSLYIFTKHLKNNTIPNMLTRESYKSSLKKIITKSYFTTLIFPIIIFLTFLFCYFYTGSFAITTATTSTGWSVELMSHPFLFIVLYICNVCICSLLYVNISLCIARKHHNYFVASILSYLSILAIELFLELFVNGIIVQFFFKTSYSTVFTIMNPLAFNDIHGIISMMIVPACLLIISGVILYNLYKDEEKLVIDCEKNC